MMTLRLVFVAVVCACNTRPSDPKILPPAAVASDPVAQAADPCPTQADDARVRAEIVNGGVALVFYTTDSEQTAALRARLHALAAENPAGAEGMTTSVMDTPDGARIDFVSQDTDPDALIELRKRIDAMVDRLEDGECTVRVSAR